MDNWKLRKGNMCCDKCMFYVPKVVMEDGAPPRGVASRKTEATECNSILGRCRRHAPISTLGWSIVFETDWCGDFRLDENKL